MKWDKNSNDENHPTPSEWGSHRTFHDRVWVHFVKTVILVPIYNCGKTLPTLFSFLYKLKPQPDLYVFAENNSDDDTLGSVCRFKRAHKIIRVWFRNDAAVTGESEYEPIAHIRQLLLTFARRYDPDYAIFLDSDVYPRAKDLIDRLSLGGKDIVGGAYLRLFPNGLFIASKWVTPDGRCEMKRKIDAPLAEPTVTSAGCLCLSQKIVLDKRINFYPISHKGASEDFGYCLNARDFGYKVYLDGSIELLHQIPKKIPIKPWFFDPKLQCCVPFFYGRGLRYSNLNKSAHCDRGMKRRKLKVGILSTPMLQVPPDNYGGLEQVAADLAETLAKRGPRGYGVSVEWFEVRERRDC